jgi:hypothetical protein
MARFHKTLSQMCCVLAACRNIVGRVAFMSWHTDPAYLDVLFKLHISCPFVFASNTVELPEVVGTA